MYKDKTNYRVGQALWFENEEVRVWHILLFPGEEMPFHTHICNYFWTSISDGTAISIYDSGETKTVEYHKGDTVYYNALQNGPFTHNLKNIGPTPLEFVTTEFVKLHK